MRRCTVCGHPKRSEIDMALIAENASFRTIAHRFSCSVDALKRHRKHIPAHLIKAREIEEANRADDLLAEARALYNEALRLMACAKAAGDVRTALMGIREARGVLELLMRTGMASNILNEVESMAAQLGYSEAEKQAAVEEAERLLRHLR